MATMAPPSARNRRSEGRVRSRVTAPSLARYGSGIDKRVRAGLTSSPLPARSEIRDQPHSRTPGKRRTCLARPPASSVSGYTTSNGKAELREQPLQPARGHRATVDVGHANPHGPQSEGLASGPLHRAFESQAGVLGKRLDKRRRRLGDSECRWAWGLKTGQRRGRTARRRRRALQPIHGLASRQQPVHRDERVVGLVGPAEGPTRACGGNHPRRRLREPVDGLERAVDRVEHAVEPHAHLEGQRIAGHVVRANRRPARIREVVRIVLRLEAVHEVRAERLRGLHDEGARRIRPAAELKWPGGPQDRHAVLDQRVGEFDRGEKVGLVGRNHVASGVARRRVVQLVEALARPAGTPAGRRSIPRGRGLDARDLLRGHRPRVAAALVDRVPAHPVDVVEKALPVLGRQRQDGAVRRQQVLDRLAEVPGLRSRPGTGCRST